jgi:hypothetical protein
MISKAKTHLKKPLLICLLIYLLTACDDPSVRNGQGNYLFVDTEVLVNQQVDLLDSAKPAVLKTVETNGISEQKTMPTTDWKRELAAFSDLNISKPGLQASYAVTSAANVRLYELKPGEKAELQWLKVGFGADTTQITSLEGMLKRSNYLYDFEKHLRMRLKPGQDQKIQVSDYQIDTKQKLIFSSEEILRVNGKVASEKQPK